jgi:1,4-dihydroxy-2-naphthoate octaprenyltransferase
MIFYESYKSAGKRTLTVRLGKRQASYLATGMAAMAYLITIGLIATRYLPLTCLSVVGALPLFLLLARRSGKDLSSPEYGTRTARAFFHSITFGLLMVLGLVL